jgi:preprotein translocase subunit SecB
MEQESADLKVVKMYVRHFNYMFNQQDFPKDVQDLKSPAILHHFEKIDQNTAKVEIRVIFQIKGQPSYFLDVAVGGIFSCPNFEKDAKRESFMKNTTIAILYPYLRSTALSLSGIAEMPQALLPIINTYNAFGDLAK